MVVARMAVGQEHPAMRHGLERDQRAQAQSEDSGPNAMQGSSHVDFEYTTSEQHVATTDECADVLGSACFRPRCKQYVTVSRQTCANGSRATR